MEFSANIAPVELIEKGAFGETYVRDICSSVNDELYKN